MQLSWKNWQHAYKRTDFCPDLAVVWAVRENGLILKDDKVTLDTLDTYRSRATTGPVHAICFPHH